VELAKCGSNLRKLGRATLIHAKHGGTFVDEVLSGARTTAQLAVGALGAALTFRPRRFMSGVPISGVGKGVALEERVSELRSRPSGLRSGLSFFIFENTFGVSIANNRYKTQLIFYILRIVSATISDTQNPFTADTKKVFLVVPGRL
jgi:hypothetical protein